MKEDNKINTPKHHGPGAKIAEKPKSFKKPMLKLIDYMHPFIPLIIIAIILALLSSVFAIIGPNKISDITDLIAEGMTRTINLKKITNIAIFLGILFSLSAIFNFIQGYIMATVATNFQ